MLVQSLTDTDARSIQAVSIGSHAGRFDEGAGAHGSGAETTSLFVRPHHQFDGAARAQALIVQRQQALQTGHHAVAAVQMTTAGLGIDMAAGHHWRQILQAVEADEQIGAGIRPYAATDTLRLADQPGTRLEIFCGKRLAIHPAGL